MRLVAMIMGGAILLTAPAASAVEYQIGSNAPGPYKGRVANVVNNTTHLGAYLKHLSETVGNYRTNQVRVAPNPGWKNRASFIRNRGTGAVQYGCIRGVNPACPR